jgi:purine-binding chemotaxis protein CheW
MEVQHLRPDATLLETVSAADQAIGIVDDDTEGPSPEPALSAPRTTRFVLFTMAATCYGVPENLVIELDRVPKITLVPQVPIWVRGITHLRGDMLSVVDLRAFLGLDSAAIRGERMLVVRLIDEEFSVGLIVDTVDRIVTMVETDIRPPACPLEGALAAFLKGVCMVADQLVAVLDLDRLLRSPDIRQFDEAKEDPSCEAR